MKRVMKKRNKYGHQIGELEREIRIPATTLRHWEKEGLIKPDRDPESGYRMYNHEDIRRLLIIRTVQSSVYLLDSVREVMEKINRHSISEARKITMDSLAYMDNKIEQQLRGAPY